MKPRRLPSGSYNVRIMIDGHTYSFTDPDRKTVLRMASEFADEHRENAGRLRPSCSPCTVTRSLTRP